MLIVSKYIKIISRKFRKMLKIFKLRPISRNGWKHSKKQVTFPLYSTESVQWATQLRLNAAPFNAGALRSGGKHQ